MEYADHKTLMDLKNRYTLEEVLEAWLHRVTWEDIAIATEHKYPGVNIADERIRLVKMIKEQTGLSLSDSISWLANNGPEYLASVDWAKECVEQRLLNANSCTLEQAMDVAKRRLPRDSSLISKLVWIIDNTPRGGDACVQAQDDLNFAEGTYYDCHQ